MRHKESPSKFTLALPKCILPQSTKFNQKKARCKWNANFAHHYFL